MKILLIILALLILWSLYGYFSSRVEQAKYTVLEKRNGYEIRDYPAHIVAQTTVTGDYEQALNNGFRIVAGYIFGANTKNEKVAMTAPVISEKTSSEKIAMTAPVVVDKKDNNTQIISFGMPEKYTLEILPTPTDNRVKLVQIPDKKFAVISFSGYRTNDSIQKYEKILSDELTQDNIKIIGPTSYAGYNAPGTPPWMTRNEVLIGIDYEKSSS